MPLGFGGLGRLGIQLFPNRLQALSDETAVAQQLHQQVKAQPHHREYQNQHDPGHFHGAVGVLPVQLQNNQQRQNAGTEGDIDGIFIEPDGQENHPDNLQQQGDANQDKTGNAVAGGSMFFLFHAVPLSCAKYTAGC